MKKQFEDFIYRSVKKPKGYEVQEILSIFSEKEYNKGESFKKGNTAIKKLGFLIEGSARTYFINDKGDEITDEIVQINNFLSDIISVRTGGESPIIIEIIEKSTVLVANMDSVWNLLENNLTFNILIREHLGDRSMALVKRTPYVPKRYGQRAISIYFEN